MGTGKTVMAMELCEQLDKWPVLVVCPSGLVGNWSDEFTKWYPDRTIQVVQGGAVTRRKQIQSGADVLIVGYGTLRYHSRLLGYGSIALTDKEKTPGDLNRPWGVVIADEAHRCKDPKAKQTRALWAIGASAEHRYAMTGTPASENPADFWTLLRFASPEEWPARSKFIDRYCLTAWNGWGGIDVVGIRPELRDEYNRVVQPRFLRRLKAMVLPELPEKVPVTREVELTSQQLKHYKQMRDDQIAELEGGTLIAFDPMVVHSRLSQFASASATLEDGKVQLAEPSSKLDELMVLLEEFGDEPLVVFALSAQLIELAAARLTKKEIPFGVISGRRTMEDREWAKHAFMGGQIRVLLLTYGAGAEGLTLTRAKTMVLLQKPFSLIQMQQAVDRIHRPGAEIHDSLLILSLVSKDTVEENVQALLDRKGGILENVTGDREEMLKWLMNAA